MRAVETTGPHSELKAAAPFVALALAVWAAGVVTAHLGRPEGEAAAPPWQRSWLELSPAQQRHYRELREGLLEAENLRAEAKAWPEVAALEAQGAPGFGPGWELRRQGVYATYLGEAAGLRWLVLFIEPSPPAFGAAAEAPAPTDEEHHTLPDGTALHVTVWTQDATAPRPQGVLAFPVTEGFVQRVGR